MNAELNRLNLERASSWLLELPNPIERDSTFEEMLSFLTLKIGIKLKKEGFFWSCLLGVSFTDLINMFFQLHRFETTN